MSNYNFLSQINFPSDLKKISESDLQKVADDGEISIGNSIKL